MTGKWVLFLVVTIVSMFIIMPIDVVRADQSEKLIQILKDMIITGVTVTLDIALIAVHDLQRNLSAAGGMVAV